VEREIVELFRGRIATFAHGKSPPPGPKNTKKEFWEYKGKGSIGKEHNR